MTLAPPVIELAFNIELEWPEGGSVSVGGPEGLGSGVRVANRPC